MNIQVISFSGKTLAYRVLAQGLSLSLVTFQNFYRKHFDPVSRRDQGEQSANDIGIEGKEPKHHVKNLSAALGLVQESGMKPTMTKCKFGVQEGDCRGLTIPSKKTN